jgi:type II secretory pathway component HofQ
VLLSLTFVDCDVHAALRLLAETGGYDLVVADDVGGRVDLTLRRVTVEAAFAAIAMQKGLVATGEGRLLVVGRRPGAGHAD